MARALEFSAGCSCLRSTQGAGSGDEAAVVGNLRSVKDTKQLTRRQEITGEGNGASQAGITPTHGVWPLI